MATTITPQIVDLNVNVVTAPTPSQLQQSGAIVSAGGSTLSSGAYQFCGTLEAVTAIVAAPLAITSITWASGTATATVAAMTLAVGQTFLTTIAGATPAGYNGTYIATVATSTTFTFALATDPGTETVPGTYTPPYVAFIQDAATRHFAQGSNTGIYVLELGAQTDATTAITALETWITAHTTPQVFYLYEVDASWDSAALNTMAANYSSPNGRTYFMVPSTTGTMTDYSGTKSVIAFIPSPGDLVSTQAQAGIGYQILNNNPSAANPAGPLGFRPIYGVTAWPDNSTSLSTILTAYANYIGTGSEGGLASLNIIRNGTTMDGTQFMWWYGIDWVAIQVKQALAAAVINGSSQNPPLVYNQAGINALLAVAQDICNTAVKYQLVLSATVTATPFSTYVAQNPNDYAAGIYNGFSCTIVGLNGFLKLTFTIDATQFAA